MSDNWNILIVDDEPDVHQITMLALKRRRWRNRGFNIVSANSAAEAQKVFIAQGFDFFHVAVVDVVMETDHAGLDLCKFIRTQCPSSVRIVLRTGQPGVAPEDQVLNDYDIEYYLAKAEATSDRLYSTVRACIRSSMDIGTLLALRDQLRGFSKSLADAATIDDLMIPMSQCLSFLEQKHGTLISLLSNLDVNQPKGGLAPTWNHTERAVDYFRIRPFFDKVVEKKLPTLQLINHSELGLPAHHYVMILPVLGAGTQASGKKKGFLGSLVNKLSGQAATPLPPVTAAVYAAFQAAPTQKQVEDFGVDLGLFSENWIVAFTTLVKQEHIAYDRVLKERAEMMEIDDHSKSYRKSDDS